MAGSPAGFPAVNADPERKDLAVVRSGFLQKLIGNAAARLALDFFLQFRLEVSLRLRSDFPGQEKRMDERRRGLQAAVKINGGNHGFRCVRQNGGPVPAAALLFAPAKAQIAPELELLRCLIQRRFADKLRSQAGHFAFRDLRRFPIQPVRRDKTQNGISQVFQSFIAGAGLRPVLVCVGTVGQRRPQKRLVPEVVPDGPFQRLVAFHSFCVPSCGVSRRICCIFS